MANALKKLLTEAGLPSLSEKELLILELLVEHGELFGLALVEKASGDLKRGTVYVTLDRMEDKGLVVSRAEEQLPGAVGLPRRLFRPTGQGHAAVDAHERVVVLLGGEVLT